MKIATKMSLLLMLSATLLLQSCMSMGGLSGALGMTTKPDDENSSLIYGYLDINQEKNAKTDIAFASWELKNKFIEAFKKDSDYNYFQQQSIMNEYNNNSNFMVIDHETGVFAIEITEPGDFCLDRISVTDSGIQTKNSVRLYMFDLPETPADGITVNTGETIFWGAMELVVKEDGDAILEPSMNLTREEVLELVAVKLEGKGWDAWIARERAEL